MRYWLQITSGRDPDECCWVVSNLLPLILKEAEQFPIKAEILDIVPGNISNTFKSVLLAIEGDNIKSFSINGLEQFNGLEKVNSEPTIKERTGLLV